MNRQKIILLGTIFVLTVTYVFQLIFSANGKVKEITSKQSPDFISIENKSGTIELFNRDDEWFTKNNLPVKSEAAEKISGAVSNIKIIDVVSKTNSETELSKYGLSSPITVSAFAGGTQVQQISIGKTSTTGYQTYIKINGKKEIFLASGNLNSYFEVSQNDLLDTTLYSVTPDEMYEIRLSKARKGEPERTVFSAEKSGEIANFEWAVTETDGRIFAPEQFDAQKFHSWLDSISELNADEWVEDFSSLDELENSGFEETRVVFKAAEKEITVSFFENSTVPQKTVFCTCSENNFPCVISEETFAKFNVTLSDFEK